MFGVGFDLGPIDIFEIVLDAVVALAWLCFKCYMGAHLFVALFAVVHIATRAHMSAAQLRRWLLAVLLLPFSGSFLWWDQGVKRFRVARWTKAYLCGCGYDRRGLHAGAVCPECGQAEVRRAA